ncbi:MAG TPA: hypothetical protein HA319_01315 [Nitrosopumilaceae archaeon]|nr:hypothetical protein [Nitrosopumilaceae archaeon]
MHLFLPFMMSDWSDFHFWETPSIKEESDCYVLFQNWIRLGTGLIKSPACTNEISVEENFVLEAIAQMGFRKEEIMKVNPSSYDLLEICSELKMFGFSIRYQELLEASMGASSVRSGLHFHTKRFKD